MVNSGCIKRYIGELPIYGKFGRDVFWNYVSFAVLGVSGIIINILIGRLYGAEILGVFNQVYALYVLFSQFSVGAIHLSVLKHVSQFAEDRETCNSVISSAVVLTILVATAVCVVVLVLRHRIGVLLGSQGVAIGLGYALPGLFFFSLNKVLLSVLNGFRRMKAYAFSQALRYVLLVILLGIGIAKGAPGVVLPAIFSGAELILLVWLVVCTWRSFSFVSPLRWGRWAVRHAVFAGKAVTGGVLTETNTRVDVLMLGYFSTDRVVGIYSFAAVLVEGIAQLPIVIRINVNPVLARLAGKKQLDELKDVIRRGVRIFYPAMGLVGVAAVLIYPVLIRLFIHKVVFMAGWPVFCILMTGLVLASGYMPFNMLLVQAGYPGFYTWLVGLTVLSNIILNAMLIPLVGMYGAAIATGMAFVLSVTFLKFLVRRSLQIRI